MAIKHQVLPDPYIRRNGYSRYTTHDQFLREKGFKMCLIAPKTGNNFTTAYNVPVSERSLHQFVLHSEIFEPVMKTGVCHLDGSCFSTDVLRGS